jgi:hypothetical protein
MARKHYGPVKHDMALFGPSDFFSLILAVLASKNYKKLRKA